MVACMAARATIPDVAPVLLWVMNTALSDISSGQPDMVDVRKSYTISVSGAPMIVALFPMNMRGSRHELPVDSMAAPDTICANPTLRLTIKVMVAAVDVIVPIWSSASAPAVPIFTDGDVALGDA